MFILYYNIEDLTAMINGLNNPSLVGSDKALAKKIWDGGAKNWQSAPVESGPIAGGDIDCRRLQIDAGTVTLAQAIALLKRIAVAANSPYVNELAEDMERTGTQL